MPRGQRQVQRALDLVAHLVRLRAAAIEAIAARQRSLSRATRFSVVTRASQHTAACGSQTKSSRPEESQWYLRACGWFRSFPAERRTTIRSS